LTSTNGPWYVADKSSLKPPSLTEVPRGHFAVTLSCAFCPTIVEAEAVLSGGELPQYAMVVKSPAFDESRLVAREIATREEARVRLLGRSGWPGPGGDLPMAPIAVMLLPVGHFAATACCEAGAMDCVEERDDAAASETAARATPAAIATAEIRLALTR
jgi:hypothetical protein